eukprot:614938_1
MSCQFNWNSFTEGLVLSAFFGGYLFGNIPGAWLAEQYGGKTVFGIGVLCTSLSNIILPICTSARFTNDNTLSCYCSSNQSQWCFNEGHFTNQHSTCDSIRGDGELCNVDSYVWILIIVRFVMGLFESVTCPALYALLNYWTIDSERSRMISIALSGVSFGNIAGASLSSFIIASESTVYGGWPNVFYLTSVSGIIWFIVWCLVVSDTPFNDGCISGKEFIYLRSKLPPSLTNHIVCTNSHYDASEFKDTLKEEDHKVQWKAFLTHPVAWALYVAHFSFTWSFYTLLVLLPTYLDDELGFDLSSAGSLSIIPYLGQFVVIIVGSVLIDGVIIYNIFSRTNARKIAQTVGTIIPGILLVMCGYMTDARYVVILLSVATALMGFVTSGVAANYSDVSPTLSNVLYAVGNTISTLPGIISPILSGWILQGENKEAQWKLIFYIAFSIFLVGTVCFWIWGTADKVDALNKKEMSQNVNVAAD